MKKADLDDLRPEYRRGDLGPGVRGKYLESYRSGTNLVLLPFAQRPKEIFAVAKMIIFDYDYIIRGIAWGNATGATTVWFQKGKFADLVPTDETGDPDFTIHSLRELPKILDQSR